MLWIALHFPRLALEALPPAPASPEPWAITDGACVLVCNRPAQARGVRDGMRVSAACALVPGLRHRPRDADAEAVALDALAAWAGQFTPNVSLEPPRALLLDIEGSLKLLGGLRAILGSLRHGLAEMKFAATIACAPTAPAALLLARGGRETVVNCRRGLEAAIAGLPLAALDCDAPVLQTLAAIGARNIRDLLALPRDGLARRCGQGLLDTLDRALGRLPAPRRFFTPPARFAARLELAAEIAHSEALLFAAKRLLTQLAGFLAARNGGIQHCVLTLQHAPGRADTTVEIGLLAPTRDAGHLLLLARERLAALALPAPVRAVALEASEILALAGENASLFPARVNAPGEWEKLVERLRARLGASAIIGVASRADHRPELASRAVQPGARDAKTACGPRPLWLLEAPRPLAEIAAQPHYRDGPLALMAGPERIESGWWDGADVRRDYYIACAADHAMLWVYREQRRPGGWYLHGIFG